MQLRRQNFLGIKCIQRFKETRMLEWVYHVQLTHGSPYRRGHPDVTLFTKSLRNTLVMKISIYLKSFVMAICRKGFLDFIEDDEISERRMPKISVLPPETR